MEEKFRIRNDKVDNDLLKLDTALEKQNLMLDQHVEYHQKLQLRFEYIEEKLAEFMQEIRTEYLDFFKNRKMIKVEIRKYCAEQQAKLDGCAVDVERQKVIINGYQNIIQIMSEQVNMLNQVVVQDLQQRQIMTKIVRREKINRELDSRKQKDEENRIVHKGGQA